MKLTPRRGVFGFRSWLALGAAMLLPALAPSGGVVHAQDAAQERAARAPLACAVMGTGSKARSSALCDALGEQLGRSIVLIQDGSNVERGESLQIVRGDVNWTVIFLRDGDPRAFTRVSAEDAAGREALFLARASRVLIREANKTVKGCLRVEPNGGHMMRSPDLVYPWVNLKRCRPQVVDVLDPWWSAPR